MLRISRKADYAIFLLATLARKDRAALLADAGPADGAGPADAGSPTVSRLMSANALADAGRISRALVANLLKELTRAEILESVRGQNGGYRLNKEAREINLKAILDIVDGPINFVQCAGHSTGTGDDRTDEAAGADYCDLTAICPSRGPLMVLHNRIVDLLISMSLQEIAFSLETLTPGKLALEATGLPLAVGTLRS